MSAKTVWQGWSYGVLLWELLTCETPYKNVDSSAIIWGVGNNSLQLPVPSSFPDGFSLLLKQCWKQKPRNRPSFHNILLHLDIAGEEITNITEDIYFQTQSSWKKEIGSYMKEFCHTDTNLTALEENLTARRREELRHAQEVREHYERKLEKANDLYMELAACLLELEKREQELNRREQTMQVGASRPHVSRIVHPFLRAHEKFSRKPPQPHKLPTEQLSVDSKNDEASKASPAVPVSIANTPLNCQRDQEMNKAKDSSLHERPNPKLTQHPSSNESKKSKQSFDSVNQNYSQPPIPLSQEKETLNVKDTSNLNISHHRSIDRKPVKEKCIHAARTPVCPTDTNRNERCTFKLGVSDVCEDEKCDPLDEEAEEHRHVIFDEANNPTSDITNPDQLQRNINRIVTKDQDVCKRNKRKFTHMQACCIDEGNTNAPQHTSCSVESLSSMGLSYQSESKSPNRYSHLESVISTSFPSDENSPDKSTRVDIETRV